MATTFSKVIPSGFGATGVPLTVTDTATLGEEVHTAHATSYDELWLWATNETTTSVVLTLEWGGATEPQVTTIPPKGSPPLQLAFGWILTGSDVLTAFADTASAVTIHGYVNRIT